MVFRSFVLFLLLYHVHVLFQVSGPNPGDHYILSLDGYKLIARFGQDERTFVYPGVFINKTLILTSPEEMSRFFETENVKNQLAKLAVAAKNAREVFDKKKAAFDTKWIKKIQNELIIDKDDE